MICVDEGMEDVVAVGRRVCVSVFWCFRSRSASLLLYRSNKNKYGGYNNGSVKEDTKKTDPDIDYDDNILLIFYS